MESSQQIKPVDISFVCWNRPQFTRWSLQSIYENTKYPHRVIVIDNGSEPTMQMQLAEMKYNGWIDQLILLDKNYGLETAKHLVMEFVDSEPYFVSTDNDILAYKYEPQCWLERLVWLMDNHPEYAAIGCRPQILVGSGNPFEGKTEDIVDFPHIPGYNRIMRTQLTKDAGAWSDKRPSRGHEEIWISERFRGMGYKVGWANDVRCWHCFGDEGDWGYPGMKAEEHGHNPVSALPKDDHDEIRKRVGISTYY